MREEIYKDKHRPNEEKINYLNLVIETMNDCDQSVEKIKILNK